LKFFAAGKQYVYKVQLLSTKLIFYDQESCFCNLCNSSMLGEGKIILQQCLKKTTTHIVTLTYAVKTQFKKTTPRR